MLAEIARKYVRENFSEDEVIKRPLHIVNKTRVVTINIEISAKVAREYLNLAQIANRYGLRTPGLADAIVYATALLLDDSLVTGDGLFKYATGHVTYIGD